MTRKWIPASVLRQRSQATRQAEADADREAAYQSAVVGPALGYEEDLGDKDCDDALIAEAVAYHVGRQGDLYTYKAERVTKCLQCSKPIVSGALFSSTTGVLPSAHGLAVCGECRKVKE